MVGQEEGKDEEVEEESDGDIEDGHHNDNQEQDGEGIDHSVSFVGKKPKALNTEELMEQS